MKLIYSCNLLPTFRPFREYDFFDLFLNIYLVADASIS